MAQNPLQEFFRQPKIFISLPSKGIYNEIGSISGDPTHLPIYGMTGMDEIMMKTPDALLNGESTVMLIESCCPSIKDAWNVNALDTDMLLTAIRIATFGDTLEVLHTCSNPECKSENEYDIDLGTVIDHFNNCKYENVIEIGSLSVRLQPLTYRQTTDFSLVNFQLQQKLANSKALDDEQQKEIVAQLFKELRDLQNNIYFESIESIDTGKVVVTDREHIRDWLANSDKSVYDDIRTVFNKNKSIWKIPNAHVKCDSCGKEASLSIDLDQTNFFDPA
jgi:hypothetical protein